jgi:hypothetical protein
MKRVLYVFTVFGFVTLLTSVTAAARRFENVYPNPSASKTTLGSPAQPMFMTVGKGSYNQNSAAALVLADSPGLYDLKIEHAYYCGDVGPNGRSIDQPANGVEGGFGMMYRVVDKTDFEVEPKGPIFSRINGVSSLSADYVEKCGVAGDLSFQLVLGADDRNAITGKYEAVFYASISGDSPTGASCGCDRENSFRLLASSASIQIVDYSTPIALRVDGIFDDGFYGFSNTQRASRDENYEIEFAVDCTIAGPINITPQMFDVDSDQAFQGTPVNYSILSSPRDQNNFSTTIFSGTISGTSDTFADVTTISVSANLRYKLVLSNIAVANTMAYRLGGGSAVGAVHASVDCPPPPVPVATCKAANIVGNVSPGAEVVIQVTIANTGTGLLPLASTVINISSPLGSYIRNGSGDVAAGDAKNVSVTAGSTTTPGDYSISVSVAGSSCGSNIVVSIANRPYFKVYGGDVITSKGVICNSTYNTDTLTGNINAGSFLDSSGVRRGSGTNLAVISNGSVRGFASALGTTSSLTFANTTTDLGSGVFGGVFGSQLCVESIAYGQSLNTITSISPTVDVSDPAVSGRLVSNQPILEVKSNDLANLLPDGKKLVIYGTGDIIISTDIVSDGRWADRSQIPLLVIVAKGGNIHIDPNVTKLDAVLIAEAADDGSKGIVYTCSNGSSPTPANCLGRRFTLNGSVVAERIGLYRSAGDVASDTLNLGKIDGSAAEVFIRTPDIIMADLSGTSVFIEQKKIIYDSINTVPPNF